MNASTHYEAGRLKEAIEAIKTEVKQHPADTNRRGFYCELLCFTGDLERADQQLDTLSTQDPQAALGVALFRHLIRAEQARQQFYTEGRLPEFLGEPTPTLKLHLEASILLREGKPADAVAKLAEAEAIRPKASGVRDGVAFEDFRDLDDLTASFFEVLTSTGKYYWIPVERVEQVEFRKPVRPRDLLWQRAHMIVRDGPDGEVYLPTLYSRTALEADDQLRLGRLTDWRGGEGSPVRGVGQRCFLVGEEPVAVLELSELTIGPTM